MLSLQFLVTQKDSLVSDRSCLKPVTFSTSPVSHHQHKSENTHSTESALDDGVCIPPSDFAKAVAEFQEQQRHQFQQSSDEFLVYARPNKFFPVIQLTQRELLISNNNQNNASLPPSDEEIIVKDKLKQDDANPAQLQRMFEQHPVEEENTLPSSNEQHHHRRVYVVFRNAQLEQEIKDRNAEVASLKEHTRTALDFVVLEPQQVVNEDDGFSLFD